MSQLLKSKLKFSFALVLIYAIFFSLLFTFYGTYKSKALNVASKALKAILLVFIALVITVFVRVLHRLYKDQVLYQFIAQLIASEYVSLERVWINIKSEISDINQP